MDPRYGRKNNNADWESSFTHILQRTRQNLDKISSKSGGHSISSEHNYARAFAPINAMSRGASPARLSIYHSEANENCNADSINRAQDMAPIRASDVDEEKVASLEQSFLKKHDSLEEQLRKENALLKERILANERTGEQCVNTAESHTHEIKELQRIYANQALQISRQNSMLDGINQELDSRRSQISKMDSWIRQEEIWRHDIEDQLNVLNKRVKSVERTAKENKDAAAEMNMKMDSLEQLLHSNSAMSSAWTAKTEAFMRRMEKQRQLTSSLARGAEEVEEGEEEGDSSTRGTPSKHMPTQRGRPFVGSSEPVEPIDADELFVTPASLMYKQGIIREVEVMLGGVENKVTKQMRSDYQADLAESSRHLRIEIQNYLYRMSADAGLAPPSFGSDEEANSTMSERRFQSPSKRESVPTTTYGKVALNQQVDAMHYRLEDMCSAMAVVKEDAENNHSSLQHSLHSLENRLDEININNQANVGSIQSRSAHIEEIVRSFEVQFYKQISEAKEDMLNKIRDNTMGANDDRAALDRRLAIMENIISTFSEKNKVSNDAIDAYFASSAEIKKFDMNCVKMEGIQVELKHVREEARALSTTLTRFTSQTPRMDDILEMRERLSNVEPLAPQVSSLQASFAEAKDTSVLLKQLIKSLEDRCNKADSDIVSLGSTISNSVNPSIAKMGHDMSVLDADVSRLSTALNGLKDSVQAQATANADKWDGYRRNIEDKLSQQQDSAKSSLQSYGLQLIEVSKRLETQAAAMSNSSAALQKSIVDSTGQLDTKLQDLLMDNISNLQTEFNAQYVTTNSNITLLKDDLVKLVQSELQHTAHIQHEHIELLSRIGRIEEQTSQIEQTMNIHHELHSESSRQRYADIHNRISSVEGEQQSFQQSYLQQQKVHAANFQDVQRQLVEAAPSRAHRRMSSFSQMDGSIIGDKSGSASKSKASTPMKSATQSKSAASAKTGDDNMYNGRRMSTFAQMTGDSTTESSANGSPRDKTPTKEPVRKTSPAKAASPKSDHVGRRSPASVSAGAPRGSILKKSPAVSPSASKKSTPAASPGTSLKSSPSASPAVSRSSSSKSLVGLFQPMESDSDACEAVPTDIREGVEDLPAASPAPKRRSTTRRRSADGQRAGRRGTDYYEPDSFYSGDSMDGSETGSDFDDEEAAQEQSPVRKTSISFSNDVEYVDEHGSRGGERTNDSVLSIPSLEDSPAPPTPMFSPAGDSASPSKRRGTVYYDAEATEAAKAEGAAVEAIEDAAPETPMFSPAHDTGSAARGSASARRGTEYFDAAEATDDSAMDIPSLDDPASAPVDPPTPMFSPAHEQDMTNNTASNSRRGTVYFDAAGVDEKDGPAADTSAFSQEDRELVASISGSVEQSPAPVKAKDSDATLAAVNNAVMLGELGKVLERRNSNSSMQADAAATAGDFPSPKATETSTNDNGVELSDFETPAKSGSGDVSDSGTGTDTSSKLSIKERLKLRANKNKKK